MGHLRARACTYARSRAEIAAEQNVADNDDGSSDGGGRRKIGVRGFRRFVARTKRTAARARSSQRDNQLIFYAFDHRVAAASAIKLF